MILQIIKKTPFLLCAGAMLVFSSCNGEETESIDAENTATETVNDTPRTRTDADASKSQSPDENVTFGNENTPLNNNVSGGVGVGTNPPHGEPGHDCAIAVGAPLSPNPRIASPEIINPQSTKSGNLNPPHGEPGHDCAVEVGKPLN
ncbi:hypothetical protein ERX46_13510 [Brumimicrobium glaciale]|uniref:Secreted protein n=1 Tax=Brumimicrobium glaciale TaxID=200475 RepID=A0A4Q4KID1_9FLAO|nr:hypothetical protein [Brumimicrobium glaciale]RYM33063.1 hypothetical protein ERX46_13510 [Brumimicrobium glaciale]